MLWTVQLFHFLLVISHLTIPSVLLFFFALSQIFSTSLCRKIHMIVRFHEVYQMMSRPLTILPIYGYGMYDLVKWTLKIVLNSRNCKYSASYHNDKCLFYLLMVGYLTVTSLEDFEILCFLKLQFILPLEKKSLWDEWIRMIGRYMKVLLTSYMFWLLKT